MMLRFIYRTGFTAALPLVFLRLWIKGKKEPGYRARWKERLGLFSPPTFKTAPLWVHAVSMGEAMSAIPLIEGYREQNPNDPIIFTCMTPTASELIQKRMKDKVFHIYLPYDTPWTMKAFFKRVQPKALVILETELWPEMIAQCAKAKVPVMMANARLTDKSVEQYQKIKSIMQSMFREIRFVGSQSPQDAVRFQKIGATPEQIVHTGNLKYDLAVPTNIQEAAAQLRQSFGQERPIWLAASTHPGEEEQILKAHHAVLKSHPSALLVLVPRHPGRFDEVAQSISASNFVMARRSLNDRLSTETKVYLGDTMGELMMLYAASDIAFVGGSLVPIGGHNPLEPAALQKPVIMGPHTRNCQSIVKDLLENKGLIQVEDADSLAKRISHWINNPSKMKACGQNALGLVENNRGCKAKLLAMIESLAT